MARILRGKRRGQDCKVHQWANDWFSVDFADGESGILSPLSVELDLGERVAWAANPSGMDREYELDDHGRFSRRRTKVLR